MTRIAQARSSWLSGMIVGTAAMLLFAPSAVWAGSGHRDYDRNRDDGRHRTDSRYDSHSDHARGRHVSHKRHRQVSHKRHHRASHKRHDYRGKGRGHDRHYFDPYCRPCNRYFDGRDQLYGHVADRHSVPYRHLEVAVNFGEFGWIYFGG
jgi:hypothetical protein